MVEADNLGEDLTPDIVVASQGGACWGGQDWG